MDKNIGSVDIDELKRARQELNQERGIETDEHMYDNYNPDRKQDLESTNAAQTQNDEKNSESQENAQNIGSENTFGKENSLKDEKDFSVYENFSNFEINDGNIAAKQNVDDNFEANDVVESSKDENKVPENQKSDENKSNANQDSSQDESTIDEIDKLLEDILSNDQDESSEENLNENQSDQTEEKNIDESDLTESDENQEDEEESDVSKLLDELDELIGKNDENSSENENIDSQKEETIDLKPQIEKEEKTETQKSKISDDVSYIAKLLNTGKLGDEIEKGIEEESSGETLKENTQNEEQSEKLEESENSSINVSEDEPQDDNPLEETSVQNSEEESTDEIFVEENQNDEAEQENLLEENPEDDNSEEILAEESPEEVSKETESEEPVEKINDEIFVDNKEQLDQNEELLSDEKINDQLTSFENSFDDFEIETSEESLSDEKNETQHRNVFDAIEEINKTFLNEESNLNDEEHSEIENSDGQNNIQDVQMKEAQSEESLDKAEENDVPYFEYTQRDENNGFQNENDDNLIQVEMAEENQNIIQGIGEKEEQTGQELSNQDINFEKNINQTVTTNDNQENKEASKPEEAEETKLPKQAKAEVDDKYFKTIKPFSFLDVISNDEFRSNGKLTYFLGKNEKNRNAYSNLKDSLNVAIFGDDKVGKKNMINSILLSLMSKNHRDEIKFVLCDTKVEFSFDVFEKSEYLFLSRIAHEQNEILRSLNLLVKEIDQRYDRLGEKGSTSIDEFNDFVGSDKKMPYIVLIYNNYNSDLTNESAIEINEKLFYILKYARIVGVYVILLTDNNILDKNVNMNLPTRMSFKINSNYEKPEEIGVLGTEKLNDNNEFVWQTFKNDKLLHLRVADMSHDEIVAILKSI